MFKFSLGLAGDEEELSKRFKELKLAVREEVKAQLRLEAQVLLDLAQREVPVDSGELRASASVGNVRNRRGVLSIRVGYSARYAVPAHEGWTPKGHDPQGFPKRKWFEEVADRHQDEYGPRMADFLRDLFLKHTR